MANVTNYKNYEGMYLASSQISAMAKKDNPKMPISDYKELLKLANEFLVLTDNLVSKLKICKTYNEGHQYLQTAIMNS